MNRATANPGLVAGAIVPHAPLLLPSVGGGDDPEVEAVRAAAGNLELGPVDLIVVLSPHGPRAAVYEGCSGDLAGFGVPEAVVTCRSDAGAAKQLAADWGVPVLDEPVDHGVLVPAGLMAVGEVPVVGACLPESTDGSDPAEVMGFTAALGELGRERRVHFVASVNSSAGLTPRAPLTVLPGATEIEAALKVTLEQDPAALQALASELAAVGASCSRGPLSAFGSLFSGRPARVLVHVWPFGVGYVVAAVGSQEASS